MDYFQPKAFGTRQWSYDSLKNFAPLNAHVQNHLKKVYLTLCLAVAATAAGAYLHLLLNIGGVLTTLGCMLSIAWLLATPPYEEKKRFGILMGSSLLQGATIGPLIAIVIEFDPRYLTILMAGVRFGSLVVQDHARNGYLAVPTRFGDFPPVVEFPNFLGVTFVHMLHEKTEEKIEKTTHAISCQVHHVDHGNTRRCKGLSLHQEHKEKSSTVIPRRARTSSSGKSVLVGEFRIHLQSSRAEVEPEQMVPTVSTRNSFQALEGKKEMYSTFKRKLASKPIKFKQIWVPKKTQINLPKNHQHNKRCKANMKGKREVDQLAPTAPPPVFKSYARQGTIFHYTAYHNKAANLGRLAYMPLLQRRNLLSVPSFAQASDKANRTMSSYFLAQQRCLQFVKAIQDDWCYENENEKGKGKYRGKEKRCQKRNMKERSKENEKRQKKWKAKMIDEKKRKVKEYCCEPLALEETDSTISVSQNLKFSSKLARGREQEKGPTQILACYMAGMSSRYGLIPEEEGELLKFTQKPNSLTRKEKFGSKAPRVKRASETTTISKERNKLPPISPGEDLTMAGANVPTMQSYDPVMIALLQECQLENEMLREQIRERDAYILALKKMMGATKASQDGVSPIQALPAVSRSVLGHTGGISLQPCDITPEQSNICLATCRELVSKPQAEGSTMQSTHLRPNLADPTLMSGLMKLAGPSDNMNIAYTAHQTPHTRCRDMPSAGVMGHSTLDASSLPMLRKASPTRYIHQNLYATPMADHLDKQGISKANLHITEKVVLVPEPCTVAQQGGESIKDYTQQWRGKCMPHQDDDVQVCKHASKEDLSGDMSRMKIQSFVRTNKAVAETEAFLAEHPKSSSMERKGKSIDKKPVGREAHILDLKTFEQQQNANKAVVGSSKNKHENSRRIIPFKDKLMKPYSFPKHKTGTLFEWAMKYNKIPLPASKEPEEAEKIDDPRYCPYHRVPRHDIEDCYVFKDVMESLIRKGELQMGEYRVNPPRPHEPPVRQKFVNMISCYKQALEEGQSENQQKPQLEDKLSQNKPSWGQMPSEQKKPLKVFQCNTISAPGKTMDPEKNEEICSVQTEVNELGASTTGHTAMFGKEWGHLLPTKRDIVIQNEQSHQALNLRVKEIKIPHSACSISVDKNATLLSKPSMSIEAIDAVEQDHGAQVERIEFSTWSKPKELDSPYENKAEKLQPPKNGVEWENVKRTGKALQIYACYTTGVAGRYGTTPDEHDEIPGPMAMEGEDTAMRMTMAEGGSELLTIPLGGVSVGATPDTPGTHSYDPVVAVLIQRYQQEIEMLKRQIEERDARAPAPEKAEGATGMPQAGGNLPNTLLRPAGFQPTLNVTGGIQCQITPEQNTASHAAYLGPASMSNVQTTHPCPNPTQREIMNKQMLEQIIETKLAEKCDSDQAPFDPYQVPYPVHHTTKRLPPGISKPPKFEKFNGQGSPKEHIAYYVSVMGDLATDESYLLKLFGSSLTGLAFEWYSNLPVGSIMNWLDMQKKFQERFHIAEREITLVDLYAIKQESHESALNYIKRWRNLSMRCKRPPHPEDAVQICKQNVKREVLEKMIGIEIKSFDRLNDVVADIENFLSKHYSVNTSSQISKVLGKRAMPSEVHAINSKGFKQQRNKNREESDSSSAKPAKRNKRCSLQEKMQKPYSFPKEKTQTLFEWGRQFGKITPREHKGADDIKKNEDPRFCLYHQLPGHDIEDCYVIKDKIEAWIQRGELQMGAYKVDPPRSHEAPEMH